MKASVEILSGIVRCGPSHHQYGDPYDRVVTFSSTDGKTAVVKGLVTPADNPLTQTEARTIIRAIKALGLKVDWERIKPKCSPSTSSSLTSS